MTTQRQSFLCPNCRRLISSSEPICPHCGMRNPGSWWNRTVWTGSLSNAEQLIRALIYANVAMFIVSLLINPRLSAFSMNPLSFLSPDDRSLLLLGATGTIPIGRLHRWWTLLSANYLHGGILHIFFNMAALRQIGPLVATEYGTGRMFVIYTASGVLGFWISYLAGVPFTIGASAAVCGLLGAALYYGKARGGVYGKMVYGQITGWVATIFIFGFLMPGINNWGHGGGLLGGILLGFLLGYNERTQETSNHKFLAGICLVLTAMVLVWAVGTGVIYHLTQ
ncbi:MAG: rhomboid family intramembrane serine protease [Syntrophobacteraceae bacterium]